MLMKTFSRVYFSRFFLVINYCPLGLRRTDIRATIGSWTCWKRLMRCESPSCTDVCTDVCTEARARNVTSRHNVTMAEGTRPV